jgi:hypothetical protein
MGGWMGGWEDENGEMKLGGCYLPGALLQLVVVFRGVWRCLVYLGYGLGGRTGKRGRGSGDTGFRKGCYCISLLPNRRFCLFNVQSPVLIPEHVFLCNDPELRSLRHQDRPGPRRIGRPTGVPVLVSRQPRIGCRLVLACPSAVVFSASDDRCLGSVVVGVLSFKLLPVFHSYIVSCTRIERLSGRRRLQSKKGENTNITAFVYFGPEATSNSEMADNIQQAVTVPRKLWYVVLTHSSLNIASQLLFYKSETGITVTMALIQFILTTTQATPQPGEHPHVPVHAGHQPQTRPTTQGISHPLFPPPNLPTNLLLTTPNRPSKTYTPTPSPTAPPSGPPSSPPPTSSTRAPTPPSSTSPCPSTPSRAGSRACASTLPRTPSSPAAVTTTPR